MSEAFGKFRNTPPRVTDDVRAGRREPQPATETLGHNIAKIAISHNRVFVNKFFPSKPKRIYTHTTFNNNNNKNKNIMQ